MPLCPAGHNSAGSDFCDRCGIAIAAAAAVASEQVLVRSGPLPPGSLVGAPAARSRYQVRERLGEGGFGTAYEAVDQELNRKCVVKELLPADLGGAFSAAERERMFVEEAKVLAVLQHPSLPSVTDYFELGGRLYMVMSLEEGQALSDVEEAKNGRLPEPDAIRLATDLGLVLGYLHDQPRPIVHRDISPDNIIRRPDDSYVLLDFGAARFYNSGQLKDTIAIGKLGFASPEVANGKAQSDGRSDLYSLGAVLYRICANYDPTANPFQFPELSDASGLSGGFRAIMSRLVRAQRDQRFQTANELVLALQGLSVGQDTCKACGRAIAAGAWRCGCGRSLLAPQAWATLGGNSAHATHPRSAADRRKLTWTAETHQEVVGGPVGADGTVVTIGASGSIEGRASDSGKHLWSLQAPIPVGEPCLIDRRVAFTAGSDVWLTDLAGRLELRVPLGATGARTTPNGSLLHLVSSTGNRWELDRKTGALSARTSLGFDVRRGPACLGDRVLYVGPKGSAACFSARTDRLLWKRDLGISVAGAAVVAGRTFVVAGTSGLTVGLDADSGATVGDCSISDQVLATPCVAGQTLVLLGRGSLSVVDLVNWRLAGTYALPAFPRAMAPVLVNDALTFADLARGTVWTASAEGGATEQLGSLGGEASGWAAYIDGWIVMASATGKIVGFGPE